MRTKIQPLALLAVAMGSLLAMALSAPASAAGTTQISGSGYYDFDGTVCDPAPDVQGFKFHEAPSGIYQEVGAELIVASLDGGPVGTFTTTYRFESKWDPDAATGMEVKGRCQHPITEGSGTGGFAGATGRLDFKDEIGTGLFFYRGHITLG